MVGWAGDKNTPFPSPNGTDASWCLVISTTEDGDDDDDGDGRDTTA